jgi:hypothetical protein
MSNRAESTRDRSQRRPPKRSRQARTALFTGLLVFAAIQAVTAFVLQTDSLRDPMYAARLRRLRRQTQGTHDKPITILMLGSSRSEYGLRASDLHESLSHAVGRPVGVGNFGFSGCGPMTHLLTWNRLMNDGVVPDLVLVEVVPVMFTEKSGQEELTEERLPPHRVRRCDLDVFERCFPELRPSIRADWWQAFPNALYSQRLSLVSWVAPDLLPLGHRAYDKLMPEDDPIGPANMTADQQRRALEHAKNEHSLALQSFQFGGNNCDYLRELLTNIRRRSVPVALVLMPEGPTYRSWYPAGAYDPLRHWVDELGREFDAPIIDYHEWAEESDFFDSHHMTQAGAAKLTDRLGREHLLPLLRAHGMVATTSP